MTVNIPARVTECIHGCALYEHYKSHVTIHVYTSYMFTIRIPLFTFADCGVTLNTLVLERYPQQFNNLNATTTNCHRGRHMYLHYLLYYTLNKYGSIPRLNVTLLQCV